MTTRPITLFEKGHEITFSYEDLEKHHGFGARGGISMAMKVLEKALPLLSDDGYVERRELSFNTCFGGPGFIDAIEMMTRAVREDRYNLDPSFGEPHVDKGLRGKFYFEVSYRGRTVKLILRDGILPHEFFELLAKDKAALTNDDVLRAEELKLDLAIRLNALDGRWVYRTLEEDEEDTRNAGERCVMC